jgi:leucyl/phenylalanyl-tRNA--protein transferase
VWLANNIQPNLLNTLWHFATGYLPDFINKQDGQVGWVRWSHRGIQFLDKFVIPRKQRPYVNSARFEVRYNQAFEEVVRACADTQRNYIQARSGQTWITDELIESLLQLRRLGHAHSFETWQEGKLVGGIWGVQIGGLVTMSSMFNRVSNASRCAMARTMMGLRDRGFTMVDMGMVPDHHVHFGAEWVQRWKYESMLPDLIRQKVSISDEFPCPVLPWQIKMAEPILRGLRAVGRRFMPDLATSPGGGSINDHAAASQPASPDRPLDEPVPIPSECNAGQQDGARAAL